jgi:adenine/guanine phosphoribosyltransferase-like PRPP-binding protein
MDKHNLGEIVEENNQWQWQTELGPYTLSLDIVPLPKKENDQQIGIASFVVMEQNQNFLDYVADLIAQAIIEHLNGKRCILITAESKGSHFVPWVWKNINKIYSDKIHSRIITLRKGQPKVYMKKPTTVTYQSITSTSSQQLNLPPKDERLLNNLNNYQLVFVDDFIGKGGTIAAVHQMFDKLNFEAPKLGAVIGSDSNLYQQTFENKQIDIQLIPDPLLLRLPTFIRCNESWQINN